MAPGCLVSGEEEKEGERERSLSLVLHTHTHNLKKTASEKKPQGNITTQTKRRK